MCVSCKRFIAGVLATVIFLMNAGTVLASGDEKKEEGILASVGGWFVDRGTDIGNAATTAADATGQWLTDRGTDIGNAATTAADATGKWLSDRGEDIGEASSVIGNWTSDRANEIVILVTDTGQAIAVAASNFDPSVLTTKEYYLDSSEKLLLGDFSDKDPTALSIGLNVAASVVNADLGMDIRDLVYDLQNYGDEDVKLHGVALDVVAVLPVIGAVKYLKYTDELADGIKIAGKVTEVTTDVAKNTDNVIEVADNVHDAAKAADTVDDVVDAGKELVKIPLKNLPEEVQQTYKHYSNCAWDSKKALDSMAEGTEAGKVFSNREKLLPSFDEMGNKLSYKEFDAYPKGLEPNSEEKRGLCRFVRDNLGNTYFTADHYKSFKLISEAIAE